MIKWLIRRRIAAFERTYRYDMAHVREILDASLSAFFAFARVQRFAMFRRSVPLAVQVAAALPVVMAEDCGPCAQLTVTLAERQGVAPEILRAIVAHEEAKMPAEIALAYRFGKAVHAHDPAADELRPLIIARWGRVGLVSLAFAIASARIFPTLKYALGYGRACTRLKVANADVPVLRRAS